MIEILEETASHIDAIRIVEETAFEGSAEAQLVDALRANGRATISLVAIEGERVVGHVLLSPASIGERRTPCLALAPVAVIPDRQRTGIGTQLVEHALQHARTRGHALVIVLGHATYYPRFGFTPASDHGIRCPYDVADDTFMALALRPDALDGVSGLVAYAPEFASL